MPDAKDEQIAILGKTIARLEQLATLTDAQKLHYQTLKGADADAFVAKSHLEREAILEPLEVAKRAANEVAYTSRTGEVFRKSDDPRMVAMAKRADAAEVAGELIVLEKRAAADLSHFVKAMPVHVAIVRALDTIPDEAVRKEAHEAIKSANVAMIQLGKAHGAGVTTPPANQTELEAWNSGLSEFAKAHKIEHPVDATGPFLKTATGQQLKAAYDATRGYAGASSSATH